MSSTGQTADVSVKNSSPSAAASMVAAPPAAFEFLDLKAQFATIREEVINAVTAVMESQQFILGREVRLFEEEIGKAIGSRHAIGCASGSDALLLAMMALGIGPEDEVITTPFTFVATAGSIARLGAKPVFVDIAPDTFNIDPSRLEAALTARTKAILPVHLFGLPAAMDSILDLAKAKGMAVIEDAAQAIGASYSGRPVGTLGTFGCFSFFPSKNLGGAGDGGLITTDDPALAERLRLLRVHGSSSKYHHSILGTNSRLDALQAAVLRVKLRHLTEWTRARQHRAERYRRLFRESGLSEQMVVTPHAPRDSVHVYNQFSIRVRERDRLREYMRQHGIPTEIYYPVPLHLQPAFSYLGHKRGDFPQAELASLEVLALPVCPELKDSHQEDVVNTVAHFFRQRN
ncbi:MAG TPA: DegT/DnrJ/EryC1/StrS family aminotransferase [Candidatus Acidoferrum sp.]|nr:DegT/DnrJ/EryC1/StrS family aminotransferase [Candidatus Acidoferrum sp.]